MTGSCKSRWSSSFEPADEWGSSMGKITEFSGPVTFIVDAARITVSRTVGFSNEELQVFPSSACVSIPTTRSMMLSDALLQWEWSIVVFYFFVHLTILGVDAKENTKQSSKRKKNIYICVCTRRKGKNGWNEIEPTNKQENEKYVHRLLVWIQPFIL